jgi:hypothetical protein
MPQEITCSACRHVLRVEKTSTSPMLTCPRCLAPVANPALVRTDLPPAPARGETGEGWASETPACPGCGREVRSSWRLCPECGEPLHRRPERGAGADLDREVRQDMRATGVTAIILGGLVGLGVLLFFGIGGLHVVQWFSPRDPLVVLFIGVLFFGGILGGVLGVALRRTSKALSTTFSIVGVVLMGSLLCLVVALSVVVDIFESCSKGCR